LLNWECDAILLRLIIYYRDEYKPFLPASALKQTLQADPDAQDEAHQPGRQIDPKELEEPLQVHQQTQPQP